MKILIFEWLTGGGLWLDGSKPDAGDPVQRQGRQMLELVVKDMFAAGCEPLVTTDSRIQMTIPPDVTILRVEHPSELQFQLAAAADLADAILLIAPETGRRLERCCGWLEPNRDKFISPDIEFVKLTGDKNATCDYLRLSGVQVPTGSALIRWLAFADLSEFPTPAVLKPADGAGSEGVKFVVDWSRIQLPPNPENWRIESFVPGLAVSVSAVGAGAQAVECLAPTGQVFDDWPIGHYHSCRFPMPKEIAERATELASRTVKALPKTHGYFGMDLVISENGHSQDCVIEINPRLTTSYCKLREVYGGQALAGKMLQVRRQTISH